MKRVACALLLAAAAPLAAQVMPEPGAANPRLQTVRFQEGQTIQLTALPATGLTVVLESGERIERVDADHDLIDVRISSERDSLLLIPRGEGDLGTFGVATDRRSYRFALRTGTDLMAAYLVRFVTGPQPPELPPAMAVNAPPGFPAMQVPMLPSAMPGAPVWRYRVKGDAAVRPTEITDDGARTVIAFPDDMALPAVFAIGPAGDEQVINGYVRGGRLVIDEVWQELVFRIDDRKATAKRNAKPDNARG